MGSQCRVGPQEEHLDLANNKTQEAPWNLNFRERMTTCKIKFVPEIIWGTLMVHYSLFKASITGQGASRATLPLEALRGPASCFFLHLGLPAFLDLRSYHSLLPSWTHGLLCLCVSSLCVNTSSASLLAGHVWLHVGPKGIIQGNIPTSKSLIIITHFSRVR